MHYLELKLHPPVVLFISLVLTYLCNRYFPVTLFPEVLREIYFYLGILGGVIAIAGVWQFRKAKTTLDPHKPHKTNALVNTGIYRFTRNPMYLGMALVLLAAILKQGSVLALVILPAFILYLSYFQIKPEERVMVSLFGEQYLIYKAKVRPWL